jgi:hypothetical protein
MNLIRFLTSTKATIRGGADQEKGEPQIEQTVSVSAGFPGKWTRR